MADEVKRVNYFNGQFLREADFTDEQDYHKEHMRDHARLLHTPGIAEGLDIAEPPAGATAVTVNAGAAYDEDGRRIVLANNRTVELVDLPAGQAVYVTIAYGESETDPTDETGIPAKTRWTEAPLIETSAGAPAEPNAKLVLGRIERSGTTVTTVDRSERRAAGVKGGDLAVRRLTLTSEAVAPGGWVEAQLGASGRADLAGSLRVAGNLIVTGSIQGDIAVNTVQTGDLLDNAVTGPKLAPNSVDGSKIVDGSIGTNELANSSVTLAKLAPNSVDGSKIVDGSIGLTELAANSVDGTKIADGSVGTNELANLAVTNAKLAANSVDGSKIVAGSIALAHLAADSVDGTKIVNGSIGTAELANSAVTIGKLAVALAWNGSFTVGANTSHGFQTGPNTQSHEFFMVSVVPTTPNSSLKWDQQTFCTSTGAISRQITVINAGGAVVAFNLKAYRLTLQ